MMVANYLFRTSCCADLSEKHYAAAVRQGADGGGSAPGFFQVVGALIEHVSLIHQKKSNGSRCLFLSRELAFRDTSSISVTRGLLEGQDAV